MKLKKIDLTGGSVLTVFDPHEGLLTSASWGANGVIIFGQFAPSGSAKGLLRIPEAGGNATLVTAVNSAAGEQIHAFPWFLPDGRHFLYTVGNADAEKTAVYVGDVDSKNPAQNRRMLISYAANAAYAPLGPASQGYLMFVREGVLMAQPFDADAARTMGDAVPVPGAEQIDRFLQLGSVHSFDFSVSQSARPYGVLAYNSGGRDSGGSRLVWLDHYGKPVGDQIGPSSGEDNFGSYEPAISPDGKTVAYVRRDFKANSTEVWLHDVARGTDSQFTSNSKENFGPVWSPDGEQIVFGSDRDGKLSVYQKAANGVTPEQLLDKDGGYPIDWSQDGRYIFEVRGDPKTLDDIWVLTLDSSPGKSPDKGGDRNSVPYLNSEFNERGPKLSPGGQWLAYQSNANNKRDDVWVESFPNRGSKWPVSTNGGELPVWSRDGRELYFESRTDRKMMVVEVTAGNVKSPFGVPKPLFDVNSCCSPFDVSKEGRFLMMGFVVQNAARPATVQPMTVVVDWTEGLKK
jgi:hypothetical protein